jgi:hypothetical protein
MPTVISTPESLKEFEKSLESSVSPESSKGTQEEKGDPLESRFNKTKSLVTKVLDSYGQVIGKSSEESEQSEEKKKLNNVLNGIHNIGHIVSSVLSVAENFAPPFWQAVSKAIRGVISVLDEINSPRIDTLKDLGKNIVYDVQSIATGSFDEKFNTISKVITKIGGVIDGMNESKGLEKSKSQKHVDSNETPVVDKTLKNFVDNMKNTTPVSSNKISPSATPAAPKNAALGI